MVRTDEAKVRPGSAELTCRIVGAVGGRGGNCIIVRLVRRWW